MISITIKGLSKAAHQALKKRAARHGRSLNTEAIAVLESSVRSQPLDVATLLERTGGIRETMQFRTSAARLDRLIREGRDRR